MFDSKQSIHRELRSILDQPKTWLTRREKSKVDWQRWRFDIIDQVWLMVLFYDLELKHDLYLVGCVLLSLCFRVIARLSSCYRKEKCWSKTGLADFTILQRWKRYTDEVFFFLLYNCNWRYRVNIICISNYTLLHDSVLLLVVSGT